MNTEVEQIEVSIEHATKVVKLAEQADKLVNSPAFKKVILDGYMRDEASRLAGMLAEPSMTGDVDQRELMSAIKAIGHLRQYLIQLRRQGALMVDQIEADRQTIEDIRAEQVED